MANTSTTPPIDPEREFRQAIEGRWDLTLTSPDGERPAWLEIRHSGFRALIGQFVGPFGSARPISKIEVSDGKWKFAIPPQWENGASDLVVEGWIQQEEQLAGKLWFPDGQVFTWSGKRAPSLWVDREILWIEPLQLFNGKDLAGWHVVGDNHWHVSNGILCNEKAGGNLVTDQEFGDFQLHIEFRYPQKGNSGVYLRGRYEVQIIDSLQREPANDLLGAIYGFLSPSEIAANEPDVWHSFDITLIGRMVTILVNGKTVICNQAIPGITGGAIDSHEGLPGPLLLQGDHGPIEFRNIILTPAQ